MNAGPPVQQGQQILNNSPAFSSYVNRFMFPAMFSEEELQTNTGMKLQNLYKFRDEIIVPWRTNANGQLK